MAEPTHKILIVEDDLDVADMLTAYFRVQSYDVFTVNWGEDGVRAATTSRPDLIILDIRLPDIDGYEVARRLRSDRKTSGIPIIFLTEKRDRADKLQGLELGADDYITKPFDVQELRLRVRNALRRATQDTLTNPVTSLPEGALVDEKINAILQQAGKAILLISLTNIDQFRENYGFVASDDVMRAVSLMLQNVLRELSLTSEFLGHLDSSDFVVILPSVKESDLVEERVRLRLEQSLDYFYPIKDREQASAQATRLAVSTNKLIIGKQTLDSVADVRAELFKRRK